MATYGAVRIRERIHWNPTVLAVPFGVVMGILALPLGREWRLIASTSPLDPTPERGMLLVAVVAGVTLLGGLALMVGARGPLGAWLFAIGVALVCGVMIGFVTGPTGSAEAAAVLAQLPPLR